MVLTMVVGELSAPNLKNHYDHHPNQCNLNSNHIVLTQVQQQQNINIVDGKSVHRQKHNNHSGQSGGHRNCKKFSDVLNGAQSIQWKLKQHHHRTQCLVTKLLRKFSEFSGHLIKMRLQWFLMCLFLFCTHTTTLARPNANNNLDETNLAADAVNFESTVSIQNSLWSIIMFHFFPLRNANVFFFFAFSLDGNETREKVYIFLCKKNLKKRCD